VSVLLMGAMTQTSHAIAALLLFALGTALSMGAGSAAFGYAITRDAVARRFERLIPRSRSRVCSPASGMPMRPPREPMRLTGAA
jgi:hypothetical protein